MENIKSYSFEEVIQNIESGEEYRGYEYKLIKNNKIRIEKYNNSEIVFDDLICDKFIKFESIKKRMELLQKEINLKKSELEMVENDLDDLYDAYLILKDELEELRMEELKNE